MDDGLFAAEEATAASPAPAEATAASPGTEEATATSPTPVASGDFEAEAGALA
ncbi:hypothetical protein GT043_37660, partial [Streptomyces sp. SID2131]|nr:hypothetical protein [Streptomyces sp. SID2131]